MFQFSQKILLFLKIFLKKIYPLPSNPYFPYPFFNRIKPAEYSPLKDYRTLLGTSPPELQMQSIVCRETRLQSAPYIESQLSARFTNNYDYPKYRY